MLVWTLTPGLQAQATKTPVATGVWGGKGIQITVTASGATISTTATPGESMNGCKLTHPASHREWDTCVRAGWSTL